MLWKWGTAEDSRKSMGKKCWIVLWRYIEANSRWKIILPKSIFLGVYLCFALGIPLVVFADLRLSYKVSIEGIHHRELKRLLESVSQTVALRERPPPSLSLLKRRMVQDIPLLSKALRSQGFYGARVTWDINEDAKPVQAMFRIELGQAYLLKSVDIRISSEIDPFEKRLPEPFQIGLVLGEPAKSKRILDAQKRMSQWFGRYGFPFPNINTPKVVVDHAEERVSVEFQVEPGPWARFGNTEIQGLESVNKAYAHTKIPWKEDDQFNADLLQKARESLRATGLFAFVRVNIDETIDPEDHLPILIQVKERKHRTVKAGVSYKTDEGPGANLSWEHRNLWHHGESLAVEGTVSGITYGAEGSLRKPEFLRLDQTLILNLRVAEDHPDAFTSTSLEGTGRIERMLFKGMALSAGLGLKWQKVGQLDLDEQFYLISLPITFDWDTSDDLLDPSRGGRLKLQMTPYRDFSGTNLNFIRGYTHYSRYIRLYRKPHVVFAVRGMLGAMSGAERDEIPADIRFYAGGGGSIRGYAYQSVGPRYENQPVGGRSMAGLSSELRMSVTKSMGFVAFVDGGNAFEAAFPDFKEPFRWGAGLGLRYLTGVGPLRLDIGIPLNKREEIDDSFQVYISLGQAF
jgi:translocation and assembly module TamA